MRLTSLSAVGLLIAGWLAPELAEKVVFLDVGQGDAILLQDKTAQVLIDGGPGMAVLKELAREMPWFDRRLEVVINTHPDKDHLEGLLHVLERYDVGLVLLPEVAHTSQLYGEWIRQLAERQVPYRFGHEGQRITAGDIKIDILGPKATEDIVRTKKTNNASVLTRINYSEMSFLLTGDAEKSVENELARAGAHLDVDVLKAGHHGSNTSTHAAILSAASPGAVVISVGENSYGHPHSDVLERLTPYQVWRTDEHGAVRFTRADGQWLLKTKK